MFQMFTDVWLTLAEPARDGWKDCSRYKQTALLSYPKNPTVPSFWDASFLWCGRRPLIRKSLTPHGQPPHHQTARWQQRARPGVVGSPAVAGSGRDRAGCRGRRWCRSWDASERANTTVSGFKLWVTQQAWVRKAIRIDFDYHWGFFQPNVYNDGADV